jgi:hypothetical protein
VEDVLVDHLEALSPGTLAFSMSSFLLDISRIALLAAVPGIGFSIVRQTSAVGCDV